MIKKYTNWCFMLVFITLFSIPSLWSQPNGGGGSQAVATQQGRNRGLESLYRELGDKNKRNTSLLNLNNDVEGSPYFDDAFKKGSIYFDNEYMDSAYLRYDAYADEIQLKKTLLADESYGALLKDSKLYCLVDGRKIVYSDYVDNSGNLVKGYFSNMISSGEYMLYVRKRKLFQKGKAAPTSLTAAIAPRFITQIEYYIKKPENDKMILIPNKKKDVIAVFRNEDRAKVKTFLRSKRIDVKNENDLLTLIYYANTL